MHECAARSGKIMIKLTSFENRILWMADQMKDRVNDQVNIY